MIHTYFVSFNWSRPGGPWGFANTELTSPEPISTIEQIREIEKKMTLLNPGDVYRVLSFQLFRIDSEAPAAPAVAAVSDRAPADWSFIFRPKGGDSTGISV